MQQITLEKGLATFLNALSGKNRSAATIRAYQTDISQFIAFLHDTNVSIHTPAEVEKIDVMEYLTSWTCGRERVMRPHLVVASTVRFAVPDFRTGNTG